MELKNGMIRQRNELLGREQGEELTDIELAVLHHALCVDEGRNESYEQSML